MIKEVATDLRIRSELQVTKAAPAPAVSVPKTERQVLVHKIPDRVSEPKLRRLVSAGIGTLLGILAFVALASIIDPQNLLNTAGSSVEVVKHNPNQETVPKSHCRSRF